MLAQRQRNAILLNEAAEQLFASPHFTTAETPRSCTTVELTVGALGFPHRAITATIYTKAAALGLSLCLLAGETFDMCHVTSYNQLHDQVIC